MEHTGKHEHRHPKGLYVLFATEMWERFSYYGMRAIFALYMVKALLMDKALASQIYGNYTGLVYLTPLIGGYVADRYWGNRRSIFWGGIMMAIGQFIMFTSASILGSTGVTLMYVGLTFLIFGNGFFKPNISTMVGQLYPEADHRRDSAYTIFYMGINLGAMIAPLICGGFGDTGNPADFKWGFLAAGIGMVISVVMFELLKNKYVVDPQGNGVGMVPKKVTHHADGTAIAKIPLTKIEAQRIAVIFILGFFVIFFWGAFEQAGASLTFFADEQTNRNVLGYNVPASFFQIINPLFILLFAPMMVALWGAMDNKDKEPSSPLKMALGLFLLALGYVVIAMGVKDVAPGIKVSMFWLVSMYALHTLGELCLSPIGLSMVNKLAPAKFASLLMAVWFLATAAGNKFAGFLSSLYPASDPEFLKANEVGIDLKGILTGTVQATQEQIAKLTELGLPSAYPHFFGMQISNLYEFFMIFVGLSGLASLILFVLYRRILKMMHGIE